MNPITAPIYNLVDNAIREAEPLPVETKRITVKATDGTEDYDGFIAVGQVTLQPRLTTRFVKADVLKAIDSTSLARSCRDLDYASSLGLDGLFMAYKEAIKTSSLGQQDVWAWRCYVGLVIFLSGIKLDPAKIPLPGFRYSPPPELTF